jgi:hypothetical protein
MTEHVLGAVGQVEKELAVETGRCFSGRGGSAQFLAQRLPPARGVQDVVSLAHEMFDDFLHCVDLPQPSMPSKVRNMRSPHGCWVEEKPMPSEAAIFRLRRGLSAGLGSGCRRVSECAWAGRVAAECAVVFATTFRLRAVGPFRAPWTVLILESMLFGMVQDEGLNRLGRLGDSNSTPRGGR